MVVTDFGPSDFSTNYRDYERQNPARKLAHHHGVISRRAPSRPRVLDVGCGLGLWANYLADAEPAWDVAGIDVDRK